jgi:stress response protein YsnF
MQEVLVAVFDSPAHTQRAVQALKGGGIPDTAIRSYETADASSSTAAAASGRTMQPARTEPGTGFWAWLTGEETASEASGYEQHAGAYDRAAQAGKTVLAVTVDEQQARTALEILTDQTPTELEIKPAGGGGHATVAERPHPTSSTAPIAGARENAEERIRLSEEEVSIGKRQVERGVTRIHRYVVSEPVERQVMLKNERVEIERRTPVAGDVDDRAFEERTVEIRETAEEPVVSKTVRPTEEIVVRKETTERPTTVREEVRKEKIEIENPRD